MTPEAEVHIVAEGLGKKYDDGTWGLRGAGFALEAGSFVALVGANGAGKTTALHLISGLIDPTTGSVSRRVGSSELPHSRLGWCSQRDSVDWLLSVTENVLLGARLAGLSRHDSQRATEHILDVVGLRKTSSPPDVLSGGQLRRMQIARALVHQPLVALLDEPMAGLDPAASDALLSYLRARCTDGGIVVLSSHDLHAVADYTTHVLHLRDGTVLSAGSRSSYMAAAPQMPFRVRVTYVGQLRDDTIASVRQAGAKVLSIDPLDVLVADAEMADKVARAIETAVVVLEQKTTDVALRDIFLLNEASS